MALYAVDEDDLIFASDALPSKTYWCLDCFGPVKRRRGKKVAHFYHMQTSSRCRLYSKTEDHMLAQLQIQKLFPNAALQMERSFLQINRIADLCWEKEKIIFEIQCSPITEVEARLRTADYRSIGYEVVWLLDDKRYNRKKVRPGEGYLRTLSTYYISIKRNLSFEFYDQFEVFANDVRVKKSKKMPIVITQALYAPKASFPKELFPKQIIQLDCLRYFSGSRLDLALKNIKPMMKNWRFLEALYWKTNAPFHPFLLWLNEKIFQPYLAFLKRMIKLEH